jgi:serine/threonine-protein kinase RsbW
MMMASLRSSPPPSATAMHQWLLTGYAELPLLRASLRQALDTQTEIPRKELDDVAERMAIVATELATNALRHARSPAVVRLSRTKSAFVLDVADEQPSVPPVPAEARPTGTGGRGLQIIQALASDTGWYTAAKAKHVWAKFTIPRGGRRFLTPRISVFDLTTLVRLLRRLGSGTSSMEPGRRSVHGQ